ncbi:MAG: ABC transporter ATP-binding protein [Pirellulales bacterium]
MIKSVLEIDDLRKVFLVKRGFLTPETLSVRALDGVSFGVREGEVFGLVGESGCGKSTVAWCALRLITATSGLIRFRGEDIHKMKARGLRSLRRRMQIIFQDPYSSLDPRQVVGNALAEPLIVHRYGTREAVRQKVVRALDEVSLAPDTLYKYPHEFSGGQRQRIAIARALILEPDLIFADEAVSALDVSVQSQVLLLLRRLQVARGLSFVFISHDLGVVRYFCQRVGIMYLGRIVEQGVIPEIFEEPLHPYTRLLRDASPIPDPFHKITFSRLEGEIPSAAEPPAGCHFHPRCPECKTICRKVSPPWITRGNDGGVACHLYDR